MRIFTPVDNFNGTICTVRFKKGVGETENPRLVDWFTNHGYTVQAVESVKPPPPKKGRKKTGAKDG